MKYILVLASQRRQNETHATKALMLNVKLNFFGGKYTDNDVI